MRSHRGQMGCVLLAVNLLNAVVATKTNQRRQSDFGGIGAAAEHGFTKHRFANRHAIQAPNQLAVDPGLYAVRQSYLVQLRVGSNHVVHDPGAGLTLTRAGRASPYYPFKI